MNKKTLGLILEKTGNKFDDDFLGKEIADLEQLINLKDKIVNKISKVEIAADDYSKLMRNYEDTVCAILEQYKFCNDVRRDLMEYKVVCEKLAEEEEEDDEDEENDFYPGLYCKKKRMIGFN